jgi:hypothetical protein
MACGENDLLLAVASLAAAKKSFENSGVLI